MVKAVIMVEKRKKEFINSFNKLNKLNFIF